MITFLFACYGAGMVGSNKIDRKALVMRHNVTQTHIDKLSPLSVGNGRFCYTADITGMQTFPELYREGIPLSTMSEWGWHRFPNTENYQLSDVFKYVDAYGKKVPYPIGSSPGREYLRANPHQTGLALIGLQKVEGKTLSERELSESCQQLNVWEGTLESRFKLSGSPVEVTTLCHPDKDELAYRLKSPLFPKKAGSTDMFPFSQCCIWQGTGCLGYGRQPSVVDCPRW